MRVGPVDYAPRFGGQGQGNGATRSGAFRRPRGVLAGNGLGREGDQRESQDAGFDGHLVKPVDYVASTDLLRSLTRR